MNKSTQSYKIIIGCAISFVIVLLCMSLGSVSVPVKEGLSIVFHKITGTVIPETIDKSLVSILWEIRMPRTFTAFFVGAALSLSGVVMQSILQNPLASSYTMGVSAGASLGAAIVIVMGVSSTVLGIFTLPVVGFAAGFLTVLFVIGVSSRIDHNMQNHTIILFGMVFSLFVNAMLTIITSLASEHVQRLVFWQMGSFSGRRWIHSFIVAVCVLIGIVLLMFLHRELDIMTFGDEQAMSIGVDTRKSKIRLLIIASFLTGAAVCFSGIIGFVDLTVPHIVRRIFGSRHRYVLPMSMILGGAFMALADMISRTILAPREIPVGAVTALVGAPFFLWVYFHDTKK
ncbi:FecCD family ABC transporter permease [Butyrivibrio proteoclasticus]|uniref:FecCD family ABC transporter permease n=1 Tax=Butyrivibrio proteoclasticus TaxID=43305 RepID=UPI00055273DA|nr:iron ABC transporter permease [Butyrivibrio proteoclasticus]